MELQLFTHESSAQITQDCRKEKLHVGTWWSSKGRWEKTEVRKGMKCLWSLNHRIRKYEVLITRGKRAYYFNAYKGGCAAESHARDVSCLTVGTPHFLIILIAFLPVRTGADLWLSEPWFDNHHHHFPFTPISILCIAASQNTPLHFNHYSSAN